MYIFDKKERKSKISMREDSIKYLKKKKPDDNTRQYFGQIKIQGI